MGIKKRGFTLIELLIVIGILSILATTVTLVLNPAEILKRSRDSQRISDLRSLKDGISFYLARASSPTLNGTFCDSPNDPPGHSWRGTIPDVSASAVGQPFVNPSPALPSVLVSSANMRKVDGTGWVPVPFNVTPSGSPLSRLPVDPVNISNNDLTGQLIPTSPPGYFYAYQCEGLRYEINANMESTKFDSNTTCTAVGSNPEGIECTDGGTLACFGAAHTCNLDSANLIYEIGNDPGLDL